MDERHRRSVGHVAFAAGASGLQVGGREVPAVVLRAAEACIPGQGEYVDWAGQLWEPLQE
ncbi:hypothetical protein FRUB_07539 [Fimbriiglobus ruber]|uniref:Uncharacterized protein n=1 Tax=Fimbriiglobus ruber TaxID=1908690 RepID=A0A225DMG6_9BACT|nr:hypothetical protein FRUB_07539 [Fimbriiglobus ruber]